MAVNDIFSLFFSHTVPGAAGPIGFTHHYRQTAQVTPLTGNLLCQDVIDAWIDTAQATYLAILPTNSTLEDIDCVQVNNNIFGAVENTAEAGTLSLAGAELVPVRSAPVVKLTTGLRGRSFRGRVYHMPIGEANNSGGTITGAPTTGIPAYYADAILITGPVSGNEYSLTIYSPTLSDPGAGPPSFIDNLVTTATLNPRMGSQRRRQTVS
jgi:hypothetical protein